MLNTIAQLVRGANPERSSQTLDRRCMKLSEEIGEVAEAWLNVTSASNAKGKTWDDVREEIADCLIVAFDIAWTPLHEDEAEIVMPKLQVEQDMPFSQRLLTVSYHVGLFVHSLSLRTGPSIARHAIGRAISQIATLALQPLPDQAGITSDVIEADLLAEVERKLAKWQAGRAQAVTAQA